MSDVPSIIFFHNFLFVQSIHRASVLYWRLSDFKSSSYLNRQRRLWAPGLDAIRPKVSFGSNKVNLFLRTLLTCSTSRAKCRVEPRPNLIWRLSITSCTVVEVSYLNDLVWPFSRKTLRTLGINGATESAPDNWLWP